MYDDRYLNKYRIPSTRFAAHDYNHGTYFITVCTANHEHYFGEIKNAKMILNELGEFLMQNLQNITSHYPYAEIPLFVIMPNHIHAIIIIDECANNQNDRRDGARPVLKSELVRPVSETHVIDGNPVYPSHQDGARPVSTKTDTVFCKSDIKQKMMHVSHQKGLLSTTVGGVKSAITKYANTNKITFGWQTRFYDRIIRDQDECNQIATYIENNPAKWEIDKHRI